MKKFFTLVFTSLLFLQLSGQNVLTTPQPKDVLIEDFTGIYCPNCPDGHLFMDRLMKTHPGRIHCMSVHYGSYSLPHGEPGYMDFRTKEGEVLGTTYNAAFFPSGLVNRRNHEDLGGILLGRGQWGTASRYVCHETAPVNVWVKGVYEEATSTIHIDVELCYTAEVKAGSTTLSIALTQSHIAGPQSGTTEGSSGQYQHNHVLRAYITPLWGDAISENPVGQIIKRHYDYVLPKDFNGIPTDARFTELTAFVSDAESRDVLNVESTSVEAGDYELPLKATLVEYLITPLRNYGFNFFECYIDNDGSEPITSATFDVEFNEVLKTINWEGNIEGQSRGYVRFPVDWSKQGSENEYSIKLTGINGKAYKGNTISGEFNAMLKVKGDVTVNITTDNYADDNTFTLKNNDGDVLVEYGPYAEGVVDTYVETIHFDKEGIYCFEILDSWGNGMLTPRGRVKWYDNNGKLIAQNNEIHGYGYRIFFQYTPDTGIQVVGADGQDMKIYDILGREVNGEITEKGIYIINGKKYIK